MEASAWDLICEAMVAVYGRKFESTHGFDISEEWGQVLLYLDADRIKTGLMRMRQDAELKIRVGDEAWPPTAFEFAVYCKGVKDSRIPEYRLLPRPKADKKTAQGWIKKIRQKLRG